MSNKKKTEEVLPEEKTQRSGFAAMRDELLEELLQAQPFEFDLNADALYRQYKNIYTRQGTDAAQDVYGRAASLTGGYANSYAQSAAAQTYNDYMLALQEKGLSLYDKAYDRYQDELDRKNDLYKHADALEKEEYERTQDTIRHQHDSRQDALAFAHKMAQLGDFSYLKELGIDVSVLEAAAQEQANQPEKISVTIQNTAQETYYTYGYRSLVTYLDQQIAYGQLTEKGKKQVLLALTGRAS